MSEKEERKHLTSPSPSGRTEAVDGDICLRGRERDEQGGAAKVSKRPGGGGGFQEKKGTVLIKKQAEGQQTRNFPKRKLNDLSVSTVLGQKGGTGRK